MLLGIFGAVLVLIGFCCFYVGRIAWEEGSHAIVFPLAAGICSLLLGILFLLRTFGFFAGSS